jgi:hypothetical protein
LPWSGQDKVLAIWEIGMDAIEMQLVWKGKECGLHGAFESISFISQGIA